MNRAKQNIIIKHLHISSRIENLKKVELLINRLSSKYKIKNEIYNNILIACIEGVLNSILHGNTLDKNKKVELIIKINPRQLTVTIKDNGVGFDHNNIPDPTKASNIEYQNGRGVFLMKKMSNELTFSEDGRITEMKFNL